MQLFIAAALPVLASVLFFFLDTKTDIFTGRAALKQIVIGSVFGLIAVAGTEFGIPTNGAVLNVRDAAPLCAGLIFGAPAGLLAGFIGGLERWLCVYWGGGTVTRLACSVSTFLAGVIAAFIRESVLDRKLTNVWYALAIGLVTETMHMLMVFITNMADVHRAFTIVKLCAPLMIVFNGVSVFAAVLIIRGLSGRAQKNDSELRHISQSMQRGLLICVLIAFVVTSLFTWRLQSRVAEDDTKALLELNINDVMQAISDASDEAMLKLSLKIEDELDDYYQLTPEILSIFAQKDNVTEINVVNSDGIITVSTNEDFIGFDFSSGEQSAEFLCLLGDTQSFAQKYQPISYDNSIMRKYVGVKSGSGFIQIGYDGERFQSEIAEQVLWAVQNRHIGNGGCMYVADRTGAILNADGNINTLGSGETVPEMTVFHYTAEDVQFDAMYATTEGYYIIASIPSSETGLARDLSMYITIFMEIIVFASLFVLVYFLIKKLIVDNLDKVNVSLSKITGGDLSEKVDVRSNYEFASLSDDINATVVTLKKYIAEAEARIDAELAFAREIQASSLPSVFPAFPNHGEFDIFARMDAAKTVGGDFYDFYLMGDKLVFLIADVSGKGIPAAMFMMRAKTLIRGLIEAGTEPADAFCEANNQLCENNGANMFVTAWLGILDLNTGLVRFSNAGHNRPVIRRADGTAEYLSMRPGFVLAGMEGVRYRSHEILLQPGDRIFLYTDGVTEAVNTGNALYGDDRLLALMNSSPELDATGQCVYVRNDVDVFADGAEQADDITMLCVVYKGGNGGA